MLFICDDTSRSGLKMQLLPFLSSRFAQLSIKKQAISSIPLRLAYPGAHLEHFQDFPSGVSTRLWRDLIRMQFNTTGSAPSEQVAPGTASRPILSADEAKNFDRAHYFSAMDPNAAPWTRLLLTCRNSLTSWLARQVRRA
jgi:hypothetical protein